MLFLLATALLASRGSVFKEVGTVGNSLKPKLDIEIRFRKTIQGPIRSFRKMENAIGSAVIRILSYRQKKTYYFIFSS